MVQIVGTNITCALGTNSEQTFQNVKAGICGITNHTAQSLGVSEDFMASVIDTTTLPLVTTLPPATKLERMVIHSIADATKNIDIDFTSPKTLFILSSTKGNIQLLSTTETHNVDANRVYLSRTAQFIAQQFNITTTPIIVSNACISGLSAIITAQRLIQVGMYDTIVVTGVDIISKFTVSGFQSFKALSPERCKPFDANRIGLNLGEAAATIVLKKSTFPTENDWFIINGAVRNDANHISGPSRVGEGSYRCLSAITKDINIDDIALINAHGTATLYNDEMESIAIDRAGLSSIPVNCYKGYLGHTLGAAGFLESILSMKSIDNNILLPTMGYDTLGVSRPIKIIDSPTPTFQKSFIKMLSGFGGCNAAAIFRKGVGHE